jgi:eukaryotic-like serine/threonine-protein kinase
MPRMTRPDYLLDDLRAGFTQNYVVERELGRGGMAVVYLARDVRHHRPVAIKVLPPELANTVSAERFLREIQTAARLVHPHILPVYDSGQTMGLIYYVMPFVKGEALSDRIERDGALPIDHAVTTAREVADALAYAHASGVIHRDIKPGNVLLSGGAHACLADFGLASILAAAANRRLTVTGVIVGSPYYISPEQINGNGDVDGRADVYSLGCMLFEMLAGHPPFEGSTVQAVLHHHLLRPPPSLCRIRSDVSRRLESIVHRAMEKDPDCRPDAIALLDMLTSLGRNLATPVASVLAAPPVGAESAATIGYPGVLDRTIVVLPFPNRTGDSGCEYLAYGLTEEVINSLGRVAGIRVAARTSSFALADTKLSVREVGRQLDVGFVLEGSLHRTGDRLRVPVQLVAAEEGFQLWAGVFERSKEDMLGLREEIARVVSKVLFGGRSEEAERPPVHRSTDRSEAYDQYLLGRYHWNRRTPDSLQLAVEHFGKAIALDSDYARAYAGLADAYVAMSHFQFRAPREVIPLAEAAGRRALELDPDRAESQATFAHILDSFHWRWEEAERGYRRAIELDPRYAQAHIWLGDLLTALGRHDEALRCGSAAVELEPLSVPIRFQWAIELYRTRRYPEAIAALQHVLEMDPGYFAARVFLAFALAGDGRAGEGLEAAQRAIDAAKPMPPLLMPLAFCLGRLGRTEEALAVAHQLDTATAPFVVPAAHRAVVYGALGDVDRAFELVEEALEERYAQFMFFGVDPAFDPLRGDRRHAEVLRRMGLAPPGARSVGPITGNREDDS